MKTEIFKIIEIRKVSNVIFNSGQVEDKNIKVLKYKDKRVKILKRVLKDFRKYTHTCPDNLRVSIISFYTYLIRVDYIFYI